MKISKLALTTIILLIALSNMLFSEEVKFNAEKMDVKENGNLIIGYKSNTFIPKDDINIISKEVKYYKNKSLIIFKNNFLF